MALFFKSSLSMRQSNIELCRLFSILLVMLVHSTTQSLGHDISLGVNLLTGFSVIGVNVFVLITGYFSTTPKKGSLVNLAFVCLFWMVIKIACRYLCGEPVTYKYLFFITFSNWFIASYIGLLFLAPILNISCSHLSKRQLWGGVFALLLIEIWFDWMPPHPDVMIGAQNGYSVFSFVILYLLGRAIRLYSLPQWFMKNSSLIYIGCSIILGMVAHAGITAGYHGVAGMCFSYINPIVILSSVAFLMIFTQMCFRSRFINHVAKSTLAVLLGHSAIFFLYTRQFKYLYENCSGIQVVAYWTLAIIIVFFTSILIDQLRLVAYKPLEKYMKQRLQSNEIFE